MKKELKELIESAETYDSQPVEYLLIIPSGKIYDGFWGKNGFNQIILLGINDKENKIYRIDTNIQHDIISSYKFRNMNNFRIDIPKQYNCVRLFFDKCVIIDNSTSCLNIFGETQNA